MADNIELDAGSGGATVATDDDGTAHHQYVKLEAGADGTQTKIEAGGGVEAGALRVTIASDSTGVVSIDDNGASVTVDGTVIANLGATDTAALAAIKTAVETLDNAISGSEMQVDVVGALPAGTNNIGDVDVLSSALPTGASTAANQTTIIGHLDGVEGILTTIDGDTGTIAGAVSGTEMQVDVVASLPAGNNNIGDVDVASVVPGTGATNLGKAEDAAHTTGDTGVMALSVRQNTASSTSGTDGDYQPLITDTNGRLHVLDENSSAIKTAVETLDNAISGSEMQVDVVGALPAGNNNIGDVDVASLPAIPAGNNNIGDVDVASVVPGTGATNLGKAEDAAHTTGDTGVAILGVRRDAAASGADTDGDYATLNLDGTGRLWTRDPLAITELTSIKTAVEILDNTVSGSEMQVDVVGALPTGANAIGKLAANSGVDIGDVDVTSISAGTNTIGDVGVKPRTTGGLTIFRSLDIDETEEEVKATAGQVFGWYIFNAAASTRYVKFYNATAANVIVGTTTPVLTLPVPSGSAANVFSEIGIAFGTAITVAATTGVADADTGAPGANDVIINVLYS